MHDRLLLISNDEGEEEVETNDRVSPIIVSEKAMASDGNICANFAFCALATPAFRPIPYEMLHYRDADQVRA
jgi:hypothetical protein